jgi:hypothetical protein
MQQQQFRKGRHMVRQGGCLCGAVRFQVEGEPYRTGLCHCADCRKESGSSFVYFAHWSRDAFSVTGDLKAYAGRSFCPHCGCRLFCLNEQDVEIRLGSLDEAPSRIFPQMEVWTKRREPWLHAFSGTGQYAEDPPKNS